MRISVSIERLRIWLLVGAGLLVTVIIAFLGYAHYRAHRFLAELPAKLGIDVTRETDAFTYSQSLGGRTIYTIHAAKALQHKDGKYTLHDVGIVVYGHNSDRADRIYGSEFEYDQKEQVATATGEVHLDLQAPAPTDAKERRDYAAGGELAGAKEAGPGDHIIHVTTSGLVFMQKLGVAATDKEIEFEYGGMTGHAVGADYDSDTGVVVLHSAVKVVGLQQGQPATLTAARAELNRPAKQVVLTQAKYALVGGAKAGVGQTAEAQQMVVHLRDDGSAERMEAQGAVTLTDGDGGRVVAPNGSILLNAESRPQSAVLTGGVRYIADGALRQGRGESAEAKAAFDKAGRLQHLVLTGAVQLHERLRASEASSAPWSERDLGAAKVELALISDQAGKAQLQEATATGDARLQVVSPTGKPGHLAMASSDLGGDVLTTHFVALDGVRRLSVVNGTGHTMVRRVSDAGAVNTSSGDALEVHFKTGAGHGSSTTDEISTAVQEGNVVMTQTPVKKPEDANVPQQEKAIAARAAYDGATQRLTLTGGVQLTDAGSLLLADRIAMQQQTGDAEADGAVKASYKLSGGGSEPVHVLASRAVLKHDAGQATFYGVAGHPARLWQGGSQVEAPMLQFDQKEKRLLAHGTGQEAAMPVHTVLVNAGNPKADAGKLGPGKAEVVRVVSRELTYSDATRQADFSGGVEVENADGHMRGQEAVVYLQAAKEAGKKAASSNALTVGQSGFMGGSVERVVATGHIEIDQPGRRATGERVVYTASDGMFVMTGTAAAPPRIMDDTRGTVTGTSLRFHAGDESVMISNGVSNGVEGKQRVRTETRVKKDR
ncbi:LptA/OstA family protein [Edaphobacter paludis]|uniref:LptA/OstA family protein n=1 Tax=Edaphobacter paludis TaxID=3035702 RepID=A0AAU7DAL9_9BACT